MYNTVLVLIFESLLINFLCIRYLEKSKVERIDSNRALNTVVEPS